MQEKPQIQKELSMFLELLHQDKNEGYENYLLEGDLNDIKKTMGQSLISKDLSIIYSQPESEVSTQRDAQSLNIGDLFALIFRNIEQGDIRTIDNLTKQLQQQIHHYMVKVSEKINELQQCNQTLEANNKLMIEALTSTQSEIQMLAQQHEENINKYKRNAQDLKKQYDDANKQLSQQQNINQQLKNQLFQQEKQYKENDEEYREASQRLIKSNQAMRQLYENDLDREIIVNMGNISTLHKSKLSEIIKYLNNDNNNNTQIKSGRSNSRRSKENNNNSSIHYSTLTVNKKSMSPSGFNSTRKQGINILDANYQTSYKELFLKSLKKQK